MKSIKKNIKGSAIIILVFLSLLGFMAFTLLASDVIKSNLIMSKTQLNSTKAYFTAEVGLEEVLWEVMKGDYELPDGDVDNVFNTAGASADVSSFLDNSFYSVDYDRTNSIRTFKSRGDYLTEHRSTEVSFCIPNCDGVTCGEDDGCGTPCPPSCDTEVGCRLSEPDNASLVENSAGYCCEPKQCYDCDDGFIWNGSQCVYDCVQQCSGLKCGDIDPNCGLPCPASCDTNPGCVLSTDPAPNGAEDSGLSCCRIAGSSYTCYQCEEGYSWNGSECVECVPYEGDPYLGSNNCYDAGVYDCFGNQSLPKEQPEKGLSCSGSGSPIIDLGMNESSGLTVFDSSGNGYNGTIEGELWPYRELITINHSYFSGTVTDFPFLLEIADLNLFYFARDDGGDIMFKTLGGVKIPHEIEYFNGNDYNAEKGKLLVWLRLPTLSSATDTRFYMYYGSDVVQNQEDPTALWSGYVGVWHLNSLNAEDSTLNNYDVTFEDGFSSVDSHIGKGLSTTGSSYALEYIRRYYNADYFLSTWVKFSSTGKRYLMATRTGVNSGSDYIRGPGFNNGFFGWFFTASDFRSSGVNVNDDNWHHVAVAADYGTWNCTFYVDGVVAGTGNCPFYTVTNNYSLGASTYHLFFGASVGDRYIGQADEMQMAFVMFNDDYVYNSYINQLNPRVMASVGGQEILSSGDSIRSVGIYGRGITFDGSTNYISIPVDLSFPSSGDFSIETWVKTYANKSSNTIAMRVLNFNLNLNSLGRVCMLNTCSGQIVPLNSWTHLAVSYNSTTGYATLYVNGVNAGNLSFTRSATTNPIELGRFNFMGPTGYFTGSIDEFKFYDYARTEDEVIESYERKMCDGESSCVPFSMSPLNSADYDTCNDICYLDGRTCFSVGTDDDGTNGLMSVYSGGACDTIGADCSTLISRNPDVETPFLCDGHQTDWTNCNCLLCDFDFGLPCEDNPCIVTGTGIIDCSGKCANADYVTAGTSCGDNKECDGLGVCRDVCHPLYGKPCGADQCHGSGTVDCDGYCVGGTNVANGTSCVNTNNDPLQDECWNGLCTECVANYGDPCNVGECLREGTIDCFGGCSACTNGNCLVYPSYLPEETPCDSGYGEATGLCDLFGTCDPCDADYLNLGKVCNDEECHVAGERDCATGVCSTEGQFEPADTYCTIFGSPGACNDSGVCVACPSANYMDPCNNATPCSREGHIMCDGVTCSETGYLAEGDFCNAGYLNSPNYPNTGTCNASHICNACYSGYLNGLECNTGECHNSGFYTCDGGCDACIDDNCVLNPNNWPEETPCDSGAVTTQPYSGMCDDDGNCDVCDTGFLNRDVCNTEECHVEGVVRCDGTCSTGTQPTPEGGECDGSITDGYPGRQTGYCDLNGDCQDCNADFVYDRPCWPEADGKDEDCYEHGEVYDCQGDCEDWSYFVAGTTCDTGAATPQDYSGLCDGVGNCIECAEGFLNNEDCNTQECHIPGKVQCDGTCSENGVYPENSQCDSGEATTQPYSGFCNAVGECKPCSTGFLNAETCNTEECHRPGYVTCIDGTCSENGYLLYPSSCDAEIFDALASPTGYCDGSGNCNDCKSEFLYKTPCWPSGKDEDCCNKGLVTTCLGFCTGYSYKTAGTPCGVSDNECDGSGVCGPLEPVVKVANFQTNLSCNSICQSSPLVGRICIDVGYTDAYNNLYHSWYTGYNLSGADCTTIMSNSLYERYGTYCACQHCDLNYGQVCVAEDDCNETSYYDCDGTCVNDYKENNGSCDPVGPATEGYCWFGSCEECDANMGDACNTGNCENAGVILCDGSCSTDVDPYKDKDTPCDSGSGPNTGACDGAGTCDFCNLNLLGTDCPVPSGKDAECYDTGVYECDLSCSGYADINEDSVCSVDASGYEGRCIGGDCVACNQAYYGQDCPVLPPYDSSCHTAGEYDCLGDPPACIGEQDLNQSLYACPNDDEICLDGQCKAYPDILVVSNISTGSSCTDICAYYGHSCYSIGDDTGATNGIYNRYSAGADKGGGGTYTCDTGLGVCADVMGGGLASCAGNLAYWTNCLCTHCVADVFEDCSTNPTWDSYDYDDECFDFGTYDCDGNCENYGAINEGTTCTNDNNGLEGECISGECSTCAQTYRDNVPCTLVDCKASTRLCDGSCTSVVNAGVGTTCGSAGYECNIDGDCVLAATELVDIVVPNYSTGRSCSSICQNDYTNRTCKSIGTDDTQSGATNGLIMYFGLNNNIPACVPQAGGSCSSIISRNPSNVSDVNYGFSCSGQLTNWTNCRCTNE